MSKPCEGDWQRLTRVGRYLAQHPRLIQHYAYQGASKFLDVWVDTDFAGCKRTRRSTNGGVITLGGHVVKSWSSTQAIVALSSGEAEYYGMVKGASMALGIQSMLADLGVEVTVRVRTDASAAKGIASRRGLGKIRHIEVHQLWLQEKVNSGAIQVMKVKGEGNLADALTKPLDGPGVKKHLELTGQMITQGRHELTPDFETVVEGVEIEPEDEGDADNCIAHDIARLAPSYSVRELFALMPCRNSTPALASCSATRLIFALHT